MPWPSTASSTGFCGGVTASRKRSAGEGVVVADLRQRLLYPRAGWLSLGLLAVMALAVAWSVQGARWLEQLEFLAPVALWAVLVGALLGMLRSTIVWTLPLGAVIGAGVVLWTVGG